MEYTVAEVSRGTHKGPYLYSFVGKSTYTMPLKALYPDMATGSDLYNIDNQSVYMYDRDNDTWIIQ